MKRFLFLRGYVGDNIDFNWTSLGNTNIRYGIDPISPEVVIETRHQHLDQLMVNIDHTESDIEENSEDVF